MGKNSRKDNKRVYKRDFKKPRVDEWDPPNKDRVTFYTPDKLHSPAFEEYYKGQQICPEEEFDQFLSTLQRELPAVFRINGTGKYADALRDNLIKKLSCLEQFKPDEGSSDGIEIKPPKPLDWYPRQLAWQLDFSRKDLRKEASLEQLHNFMKKENNLGGITRQEAVSMIPPLLLHVQPHHRVLDMCAAPGSKTFQLLEILHGEVGNAPTGVVIANDADMRRCNLLVHQTKRLCSPNLVVTNHEAQQFPLLDGYLYDRILVDVPCSGDGTLRKSPDMWRTWTPAVGNGLHNLQLRIALQAFRLLKVGGVMVYSTCSFNPVENEAVVAELLRRTEGALELIDVSDQLPQLKRRAGLKRWRVKDKENWYSSWEDAYVQTWKLDPTMFPDSKSDEMPLERCMRLLPHHADTGGFFISAFRKNYDLKHMPTPYSRNKQLRNKEIQHKIKNRGVRKQCFERGQASMIQLQEFVQQEASKEAQPSGDALEKAISMFKEMLTAVDAASETYVLKNPYQLLKEVEKEDQNQEPEQMEVEDQYEDQQGQQEIQDEQDNVPEISVTNDEANGTSNFESISMDGNRSSENMNVVDLNNNSQAFDQDKQPEQNIEECENVNKERETYNQQKTSDKNGANYIEMGKQTRGVEPVILMQDKELVSSLTEFYGFENLELHNCLISRNQDSTRPKRLYLIQSSVREFLKQDQRKQLKVMSLGVKAFEKHEIKGGGVITPCIYRLVQEGLPLLLPHIKKQRVYLTMEEIRALLSDRMIGIPEGVKIPLKDGTNLSTEKGDNWNDKYSQIQHIISDQESIKQLENTFIGGCVCILRSQQDHDKTENALVVNAPVAISCWRGRTNISVLVQKLECSHILDKLDTMQTES